MWDTNVASSGQKRDKETFPLEVAVDNVKLFKCQPNPNLPGVEYTFMRTTDDAVSFLTDSVLPPKEEWCVGGKVLPDGKIQTPEEDYAQQVRIFISNIVYIATNCGVPKEKVNNIKSEDLQEFLTLFCSTVMENKTDDLVYLKTVKDKNGYTKLPKYRGKGFIAPMSDGYPVFEYTDYENKMIADSGKEGVEEEPLTIVKVDTSSFDAV